MFVDLNFCLHPKATQMIEAFDKASQLVNDEVLTTTKA